MACALRLRGGWSVPALMALCVSSVRASDDHLKVEAVFQQACIDSGQQTSLRDHVAQRLQAREVTLVVRDGACPGPTTGQTTCVIEAFFRDADGLHNAFDVFRYASDGFFESGAFAALSYNSSTSTLVQYEKGSSVSIAVVLLCTILGLLLCAIVGQWYLRRRRRLGSH